MDNPEKLTILGTQDTGRRQTKSTQNKKHTTQKTKTMSNIYPYSIIFSFVTYLRHWQKQVCTRFAELQSTGSDLHISNYIL